MANTEINARVIHTMNVALAKKCETYTPFNKTRCERVARYTVEIKISELHCIIKLSLCGDHFTELQNELDRKN